MAVMLGQFTGGLVAMLILSRITMWALKGVGDNPRRIGLAHALAFALAIVLGGFGFADGGAPRFGYAAASYALPALIVLAVDFLALKGRRSRRGDQAAGAK